jgi:hypothetical protein
MEKTKFTTAYSAHDVDPSSHPPGTSSKHGFPQVGLFRPFSETLCDKDGGKPHDKDAEMQQPSAAPEPTRQTE